MRVTLGRLRGLIREALDEAPLADVLPPGETKPVYSQDTEQRADAQKKVKKFFAGKHFRDSAVKAYKNLSVPIYVVPMWAEGGGYERLTFLDPENLEAILQKSWEMSPQKSKELADAAGGGAAIFIAHADSLTANFLPTPWMIVHAIFDSGDAGRFSSNFQAISDCVDELDDEFTKRVDPKQEYTSQFGRVLTMASARNNVLDGTGDVAAEVMCQAILTSPGFTYKVTGDPEIDGLVKRLAGLVQDARSDFERAIRGRVIVVDVYSEAG